MRLKLLLSRLMKFCFSLFLFQALFIVTLLANGDTLEDKESRELQDQSVSGRVLDEETGEGLPGVNVVIKGTNQGAVTDLNGLFQIAVPGPESVLVFSYVGYINTEVRVGSQSVINLSLTRDVEALEELVVVGYGTQESKNLTGAISSVKMKELRSLPLINASQALQGRAAGVSVTQASGAPGADMVVQVRGVGSLGNTEPLFVIDGVIGAGGANTINPSDIESIEVLKDAASAAIYGSRAANGVVLITTKRGKTGKPTVSLNSYYGVQEAWKKLDVLNARQYAEYANDLQQNAGRPVIPNLADPSALEDVTDWQDAIFRTAPIQEHNLSVSGGTENVKYMISGGYLNQEGIVRNTDFNRMTFRANTDFQFGRLSFGESLNLAHTTAGNNENFAMMNSLFMPTYIPVYNSDNLGGFDGPNVADGMDAKNPVRILELTDRENRGISMIANAYANYEFIPGLDYRFSASLTYSSGSSYNYTPVYNAGERDINQFTTLSEGSSRAYSPLFEHTLNYRKTINKHNFSVLAGYTRQHYYSRNMSVNTRDYPNTIIRVLDAATDITSVGGGEATWALTSQLARITYDYDGKYLFTGAIRRDGSSRFAEGNYHSVFPSFSVGWRISSEPFMSSLTFLDDLKVRYGWGQLGNQEIGLYPTQAVLFGNSKYIFGEDQQVAPAVTQRSLANRDLVWETTIQSNIGFDASLFGNSLNLSVDYWKRNTEDMLLDVPVPNSSGIYLNPTLNAGSVLNRGLDVSLGFQKTLNSGFYFGINANMGYLLENKVTSMGDRTQPLFGPESLNRSALGESIGHFYGYRVDRIYQAQAEIDADNAAAQEAGFNLYQTGGTSPGDIRFKDLNGDGVVNAEDREIIGNPIPELNYGATLNLGFKNFDFSMMFQGMSGFELYNKDRARVLESMTRAFNTTTAVLDRWTPTNPSTTMPRAVAGDPNDNDRFSDRWMEDGSFLRLKNATIGYSLPSSVLGKIPSNAITSVRVYISGQNLITVTDFSAWDPELTNRTGNVGNPQYRGVAESIYPQARTYMMGVQVTF